MLHHDLPKWPKRESGSSILHNLPNKNKNKTSDPQHVNLPFLSAVKNKSREERSTCYTVSVRLHRSTISRPKLIQIFSKTSRLKAFSINISSPFLVFPIFLNSGIYLTINIVVFDHSNFPNNMSPESPWKPADKIIAGQPEYKSRETRRQRFLAMTSHVGFCNLPYHIRCMLDFPHGIPTMQCR